MWGEELWFQETFLGAEFRPAGCACLSSCMKKEKKVRKIHPSIRPSISQFDRFFWRWHKQKLGRPPLPGHQGLGYSRNHQVFIVLLLTFHGHPSLLIGHNRTGRIWSWLVRNNISFSGCISIKPRHPLIFIYWTEKWWKDNLSSNRLSDLLVYEGGGK